MTPLKGALNYPGVSQIARIIRYREPLKKDRDDFGKGEKDYTESVYLITSLDAGAASPEQLIRLNRGHWAAENLNHRQRGCVFGEDACLTRTGHGPANRASLKTIALAVIFASRREAETLAETRRRLQLNHCDAIAALTLTHQSVRRRRKAHWPSNPSPERARTGAGTDDSIIHQPQNPGQNATIRHSVRARLQNHRQRGEVLTLGSNPHSPEGPTCDRTGVRSRRA